MVTLHTACVLCALAAGIAHAELTNGLAAATALYGDVLAAYWRGDNTGAFSGASAVAELFPDTPEARRARYLMNVIWQDKLTPGECAAVAAAEQDRHPWLAALAAARSFAASGTYESAAEQCFKAIITAPDQGWCVLALRELTPYVGDLDGTKVNPATQVAAFTRLRTLNLEGLDEKLNRFFRQLAENSRSSTNPPARAAAYHLLFMTGGNLGHGVNALRAYADAQDYSSVTGLIEQLCARFTNEYSVYQACGEVLDRWDSQAGLALMRHGLQTVPPSQRRYLRDAMVRLCTKNLRYTEAIALLEEMTLNSQPGAAEHLRALRNEHGGLYLPVRKIAITDCNPLFSTVRRDGTIVLLARNHGTNVLHVFDRDGREVRTTALPSDEPWPDIAVKSFAVYPDGTVLIGRVRTRDDGTVVQVLPLPRYVWQASASEAGEVAALTPRLWLIGADGECVLSNVLPAGVENALFDHIAFSGSNIVAFTKSEAAVLDRTGRATDVHNVLGSGRLQPPWFADARGYLYVRGPGAINVFGQDARPVHAIKCPTAAMLLGVDGDGAVHVATRAGSYYGGGPAGSADAGEVPVVILAPIDGGVWSTARTDTVRSE